MKGIGMIRSALAALVLAALSVGTAWAQGAPPTILRGTITTLDGDKLSLALQDGGATVATLTADTKVALLYKVKIEEIKPNSFIGTTAMTQADGTLVATEVHVFPEAMRGAGEGHYAWGSDGHASMTNGTVGSVVGAKGRTVTVNYKGGEQQVIIPDTVPIVTFSPADRSLLTPGAHVIAFGKKAADGSVTLGNVSVGKDGLVPPM